MVMFHVDDFDFGVPAANIPDLHSLTCAGSCYSLILALSHIHKQTHTHTHTHTRPGHSLAQRPHRDAGSLRSCALACQSAHTPPLCPLLSGHHLHPLCVCVCVCVCARECVYVCRII